MTKLLIVDDEYATRNFLKKFINFKENNIQLVGEAENGEIALDYFIKGTIPDIVITDMNMPIMNGDSFMRYISSNFPKIKIVVVSGYFEYKYTKSAFNNGAMAYLLKPISKKELDDTISKCCEKINIEREIRLNTTPEEISVNLKPVNYQFLLEMANQVNGYLKKNAKNKIFMIFDDVNARLINLENSEKKVELASHLFYDNLCEYCVLNKIDFIPPPLVTDSNNKFKNLKVIYTKYFSSIEKQKQDLEPIEQIKNYIDNNYRDYICNDDLSERFNLTKEYMSYLFHKTFKITISKYITKLKIDNAKQQLLFTSRSILDISSSLGYEDEKYFSRVFKKNVGMPPSQYKVTQMKRKENEQN